MQQIYLELYQLVLEYPERVMAVVTYVSIAIGILGTRMVKQNQTLYTTFRKSMNARFFFTVLVSMPLLSLAKKLPVLSTIFTLGPTESALLYGVFAETVVSYITSNAFQRLIISFIKTGVNLNIDNSKDTDSFTDKEDKK